MKRKLRSQAGETLTETLCAVLIVGLAAALLMLLLASSSRMNRTAEARQAKLYEDLSQAEARSTPDPDPMEVVVKVGEESTTYSLPAYGREKLLHSYGEKETTP